MAIISIQNNFDCSILVDQNVGNLAAGTGYQVLLANPFNETNVRILSPFFSSILVSFSLVVPASVAENSPRLPIFLRGVHDAP